VTSAASRPGCGGTPTSSTSSSGCASGTSRARAARPGPDSTGSTSTASTPRWRPSSPTSTGSTRKPRSGRESVGGAEPCEEEVVQQLVELRNRAAELASRDGSVDADGEFYAEQNARLVVNAEEYYQAAFRGGVASWNLRDLHMAETLEALVGHLERTQGPTKAVAPAHNSHVGDQPCSRPVPPTAIAYLADQGSRLARQCCASGRQS
jgi:hypothetical protein